MPRHPLQEHERISLRIASEDKSVLMRAAVLEHSNLTEFVLRTVISAAKKIIEQSERIELTEKDSLQVQELLENPPEPNEKLISAAFLMPKK